MINRYAVLVSAAMLVAGAASAMTIPQADNFINHVSIDLLNRPADPGAYGAYESPLVLGTLTTTQVAMSVLTGNEYRTILIDSYFSSYLNRAPFGGELTPLLALMGGGATDQQIQATVLATNEFFAGQGSTNALFVGALYTDLLNRTGSPAETTPFVNALNTASATRTQIAMIFLTSVEYDGDLVNQWYSQFLGRSPGTPELNTFVTAMQGATTNEQVIATILGSQEYFDRAQRLAATPEPATWAFGLIGVSLVVLSRKRRAG